MSENSSGFAIIIELQATLEFGRFEIVINKKNKF